MPHQIAWRGGFGDPSSGPAAQRTISFDLTDSKLIAHGVKDAKSGPVTAEGNYAFAGVEDTYFTAVFLPSSPGPMKLGTFSDTVVTAADPKEQPHVGAGVASGVRNDFAAFVGPKDIDILTKVNPQLARIIDYGWFSFLAKPLFLALHYVNDRWLNNYGWAIIIVTILINFLLFPLKLSNLKSMKKMQALQPQIAAINEKYKGISMRDPRAQQKNEETMALYKKHGANPMGGCLPMVIQIPFFIAFYKVLVGLDRTASRELAVGFGSCRAGTSGHPHSAHRHDRDAIRDAENDAVHCRRSQPAENDAHDAARNGLYLLRVAQRPGVILLH